MWIPHEGLATQRFVFMPEYLTSKVSSKLDYLQDSQRSLHLGDAYQIGNPIQDDKPIEQ
jgi:hypothetical protein